MLINKHGCCSKAQGLTLIELMIVLAIIGILASAATYQYAHYTKKAKFSDLIRMTAPYKSAIQLCIQDLNQVAGCTANSNSIPQNLLIPNRYLQSLTAVDGLITVTATAEIDSLTYRLRPNYTATTNKTTWSIEGTCLTAGYCKP